MIDFLAWKKGWALLDPSEKRQGIVVLMIMILAALFSAGMVGSIMPFLAVLGDPSKIQDVGILNRAYESGGFTSTYSFLIALGGVSLGVIVVASLVQILRSYAVSRFAMMRVHSLSYKFLSLYLRQPYEFFLNHHTGEMGTHILSESQNVVNQFFRPAANVIASIFSIIAIIVLLLWVNVAVTFACFAVLGIIYGGTFLFSRRILARLGEVRLKTNKSRYRIATEVLGGIKDVKLLGREKSYLDRFETPSREMAWTQVIAVVTGEVPSFVLQGLAFGGMIVLALVLLDPTGIDSGQSLGGILPLIGVFAFAGQRLIPELQRMYQGLTQLQYGKAGVEAMFTEIQTYHTDALLPESSPPALGLQNAVELRDVSYTYPNSEQPGLKNLNFTIKAGEKIGIVGSTGAGKTTLADMLLGLIQPGTGAIYVDGVALDLDNIRAWQQTVGYVPQDIFLVDASIKENVVLGVPIENIDFERVKKACEIAKLHSFITEELPEKYDTLVGERGVRLSGGQRQRIGIARALYHNADFFVFDEATSALDNLTEREVMSAINALPRDTTIMMIAHRLSTVKGCDRIVVLDQGEVVGFGTWAELMNDNAVFQKIAHGDTAA